MGEQLRRRSAAPAHLALEVLCRAARALLLDVLARRPLPATRAEPPAEVLSLLHGGIAPGDECLCGAAGADRATQAYALNTTATLRRHLHRIDGAHAIRRTSRAELPARDPLLGRPGLRSRMVRDLVRARRCAGAQALRQGGVQRSALLLRRRGQTTTAVVGSSAAETSFRRFF